MTRPARLWLAAVVWIAAGCGHSVEPTREFTDPESIPLPENVTATPTTGGINVDWFAEDRIFAFIDGWNIYRARSATDPPDDAYIKINREPFIEQMFIDADVENDVRYWYRLTSVTPANIESVPTLPVNAKVDFTPPDPPTGVTATAASNRVRLMWDVHLDPDVIGYNVFRTPPDPPLVEGRFPREQQEWIDDVVAPGDTLKYWLTSTDTALNESAPSETVTVIVPLP